MPARAVKQPDFAAFSPDLPTIRRFLNHLDRDWLHLVAIDPNNKDGRTYGYVADGVEDACEWVEKQQARGYNVYYSLNTPSDKQSKKAGRHELRRLRGLQADLDLPADLDRQSPKAAVLIEGMINRTREDHLLPGQPVVVMSGNGVQAVWLLDEPVKATADTVNLVETYNKRLLAHFDRPKGSEWDASRILRVPGTWNFPSAAKVKRNCVPVLSQLVCLSSQDYCLSDFDKLPKVAETVVRDLKTEYKDYTAQRYKNWNPYTWRDVVKYSPQLPNEVVKKYKATGSAEGRSPAAFTLIHGVIAFLVQDLDQKAETFLDDNDIKRNILEIVLEAADDHDTIAECIARYDERDEPVVHLGADVYRALCSAAQEGIEPSVRREAKNQAAQEVAAINGADEAAVTVLDAVKAFLAWVAASVPKDHLPNRAMGVNGPAPKQPTTAANVRYVLAKSGITARWDAMRDEPRFYVDPAEGLSGANPHRPAFNWGRALSKTRNRQRVDAEVSLLCDAMCEVGLDDRRKLEVFLYRLAQEDSYHPLEVYCQHTPWDGVDRIGELADVLDSDHPLKRRYLEIFLFQGIAAVKSLRHYERTDIGLQLSASPVLVGAQGLGKSTFFEKIAPPGMLSRGTTLQIGGTREADSMAACLSGLICQLSEIGSSMRRSDADAFKNFQSNTVDTYRVSYSPVTITKPRMTIFGGSANPDFLLTDPTGSRRYLAMTVRAIDWDALARVTAPASLQQLWAQAWEAVMLDGESWTLTPAEDVIRAKENEPHSALSTEEAAVDAYMSTVLKGHHPAWLNYKQVCSLLGLQYAPRLAHGLKAALEKNGCVFKLSVSEGKQVHRKVFRVPVTAERLAELRTLGK